MDLQFLADGKNKNGDRTLETDLLSGGVGPAGIKIGIAELGLTWSLRAEVNFNSQGASRASLKYNGGFIGNSALITADLIIPKNSQNKGWDHYKHNDPVLKIDKLGHETYISTGLSFRLEFGFNLPNIGVLETSLRLPFPQLEATILRLQGTPFQLYEVFGLIITITNFSDDEADPTLCKNVKNRESGFSIKVGAKLVEVAATSEFVVGNHGFLYQRLPLFVYHTLSL